MFAGNPHLYLSLNATNKQPSLKHSEYSLTTVNPEIEGRGKSIYIPAKRFTGCQDENECGIFATVFCSGDQECKYSLMLTEENSAPRKISFGKPLNQIMRDNAYTYYYVVLKEGKTDKDILLVLSSDKRNADLYVSL